MLLLALFSQEEEEREEEREEDDMSFEFSAPTPLMPKLSLQSLPKNGQTYHEEFMSHSDTFSKSWREEMEEEVSFLFLYFLLFIA